MGPHLEQQDLPEVEAELLDVRDVGLQQRPATGLLEVQHEQVDLEGVEVEAVPRVPLAAQLGGRGRAAAQPVPGGVQHPEPAGAALPHHGRRREQLAGQVEVGQLGEVADDQRVRRQYDGTADVREEMTQGQQVDVEPGGLGAVHPTQVVAQAPGADDGDRRAAGRGAQSLDVQPTGLAGDHPGLHPAAAVLDRRARSTSSACWLVPRAWTTTWTASGRVVHVPWTGLGAPHMARPPRSRSIFGLDISAGASWRRRAASTSAALSSRQSS